MKSLAKELLRWTAIVVSAGCGIFALFDAGRCMIRNHDGWLDFVFIFAFNLFPAALCFAATIFCLRRQYRKLFLIVGGIGAFAIFFELSALPEQLGICELVTRLINNNHEYAFVGFPLAFLFWAVPIYAAAWFFQWCRRLANPLPASARRLKTQATRSLIWLGLFCLVVPGIFAMPLALVRHEAALDPAWIANAVRWMAGISLIGSLLIFLGLVRRRPISSTMEAAHGDFPNP